MATNPPPNQPPAMPVPTGAVAQQAPTLSSLHKDAAATPVAASAVSGAPSLTGAYDESFKKALEASRAAVTKQFELALADVAQREEGAKQAVGMLPGQVSTIYQQGQAQNAQTAQNLDAAQQASGLRSFLPANAQMAPLQAAATNDLAARQADVPLLQLAVQGAFNQQRGRLSEARIGAEGEVDAEERLYLKDLASEQRKRDYEKFLIEDERKHADKEQAEKEARENWLVADDRKRQDFVIGDERKHQEKVKASDRAFQERTMRAEQEFAARQAAADRAHAAGIAAANRAASAAEAAAGRAAADRRAAEDRKYSDKVREDEQAFSIFMRDIDRIAEKKSRRDEATGLSVAETNNVRKSKAYKDVLESMKDTKKSSGQLWWRESSGHKPAKPEDIYKKYRTKPALLKVLVADIPELAAYIAQQFGTG